MGNVACMGKPIGLEGFCCDRGLPVFLAPNTEHVTFSFDYANKEDLKLSNGLSAGLADLGFKVESTQSDRRLAKWYTIKECAVSPAKQRLCLSGRAYVQLPPGTTQSTLQRGFCAMKVCTRGRPVFQSVRTKTFTHTAQVTTSGIIFALFVSATSTNIFLCPRILLILDSGDEVVLVDDRLGPLQAPLSFHVDFAILDDGGRNLQMDLIFRGPANSTEEGASQTRTLRTCLQEYTAFNSHVQPANICIGSSELEAFLPGSMVYLQNLVISEEKHEDAVPEPVPYDVWRQHPRMYEDRDNCAVCLFEGADAKVSANLGATSPEAPPREVLIPSEVADHSLQAPEDFWYHIRYSEDKDDRRRAEASYEYMSQIKGEFWLSKQTVDKKNVYFRTSATLGQAATMCTMFRFSCPTDYLSLIESQAAGVLRDAHIPTNGVVFGVELDPRHPNMYRMFMEHRNQILDDMVICESRPEDVMHIVVHQEIYDTGAMILYRVILVHRDGTRQAAVLQTQTDQFEDPRFIDSSRAHYQLVEEPSPRFPISPCLVRHNLSPANRILVYSSMAYDPPDPAEDEADAFGTPGPPTARGPGTDTCMMSEGTAEDWQSAGGGYSDGEGENAQAQVTVLGLGADVKPEVRWKRPFIESVLLVGRMQDPPFSCFPMSLS